MRVAGSIDAIENMGMLHMLHVRSRGIHFRATRHNGICRHQVLAHCTGAACGFAALCNRSEKMAIEQHED